MNEHANPLLDAIGLLAVPMVERVPDEPVNKLVLSVNEPPSLGDISKLFAVAFDRYMERMNDRFNRLPTPIVQAPPPTPAVVVPAPVVKAPDMRPVADAIVELRDEFRSLLVHKFAEQVKVPPQEPPNMQPIADAMLRIAESNDRLADAFEGLRDAMLAPRKIERDAEGRPSMSVVVRG